MLTCASMIFCALDKFISIIFILAYNESKYRNKFNFLTILILSVQIIIGDGSKLDD